jgi:hypothetical protein
MGRNAAFVRLSVLEYLRGAHYVEAKALGISS